MPWCFRMAYHYCIEQDYVTEKKHWQAQEDTLALNGILCIVVELFNRQQMEKELRVTEVDAHGPHLTDSIVSDQTVTLKVNDAGIGVDFHGIYAVDQNGSICRPISFDQEEGQIIFAYPEDNWDVYIPDYLGNVLHLAFTID